MRFSVQIHDSDLKVVQVPLLLFVEKFKVFVKVMKIKSYQVELNN